MKERTVERGRGCWNCKSFLSEASDHAGAELFRKRFNEVVASEEAAIQLVETDTDEQVIGVRPDGTKFAVTRMGDDDSGGPRKPATFQLLKYAARQGFIGICTLGKGLSHTDFKHYKVLCNSWTGRTGHSLATSFQKLDPLADELKDKVKPV